MISYKHTVDPPWAWDTERARTLQRYKQTTKRNTELCGEEVQGGEGAILPSAVHLTANY